MIRKLLLALSLTITGLIAHAQDKIEITDADYANNQVEMADAFRSDGMIYFVVAVILLGATLALSFVVDFREKIPAKKNLEQFPLKVGEWSASRRQPLKQKFIDALDLSEYVIIDYRNRGGKQFILYWA